MASLVLTLTVIRYMIGLCPKTKLEAHECDINPDHGTRENLLVDAMPELKLEEGGSRIWESPASQRDTARL